MKNNLSISVIISNILFYLGVLSMIYLFYIDDNTPKWLVSIIFIVVGILGAALPDMMINVGIEGIGVFFVRATMIVKYVIFLVLNICLVKNAIYTILIIGLLFLMDIILELFLIKQIMNTNIGIAMFINELKSFNTSIIDKNIKYIVMNIFGILLFLSMHETRTEFILALLLCIIIHIYSSEKIISNINSLTKKNRYKVRFLLWLVEIILIFFSYLNYSMLTYGGLGTYYMIVTDLLMERKTSIIKIGEK